MRENSRGNILVRRAVIVTDFVILNLTLLLSAVITPDIVPPFFSSATKTVLFAANAALFVSEYFYSTIIHVRKVSFEHVLNRTFNLAAMTSIIFFLSIKFMSDTGGVFLYGILFTLTFYAALLVSRAVELLLLKNYRKKGYNRRTVLFVGNDPAVLEMYRILTEDPTAGYHVLGYYADEENTKAPAEFKRLGSIQQLNEFMATSLDNTLSGNPTDLKEVFCCLSHNDSDEIVRIMRFCDKNIVHFCYLPRQFGEYKLHLDSQMFMGKTIYSNHIEPLANGGKRLEKRLFDVVVSFIACLCFLPFFPIVALIIKSQSPGPIFFRQQRTGLNGKTFLCLKFRSMHVNKDADKTQATKDDPRKFAFGDFMRKTNIDEFPQFLNVLKGDMSIVGPRPHMLHHTEIYGTLIDKYMVRHFSKPGITGWAQVTGYRGETKELWQMEERIRRDIWYIENWSFWLDIKIILLTAKSIIMPDKNAY